MAVDPTHSDYSGQKNWVSHVKPIQEHSGNKYKRLIKPCVTTEQPVHVDVYSVIDAYQVTNPGIQHAIKKLLCSGLRNKGDMIQDLE